MGQAGSRRVKHSEPPPQVLCRLIGLDTHGRPVRLADLSGPEGLGLKHSNLCFQQSQYSCCPDNSGACASGERLGVSWVRGE